MLREILSTALILSTGSMLSVAACDMNMQGPHDSTSHAVATKAVEPAQTTCPVMKGPIDKNIFVDYQGKRVYFCCADCKGKFLKEPAKYLQQSAAETGKTSSHAKALELQKSCPIMGGPIDKAQFVDYQGLRIYVCCPGCIAKVKANPQAAIDKLATLGEAPVAVPSK